MRQKVYELLIKKEVNIQLTALRIRQGFSEAEELNKLCRKIKDDGDFFKTVEVVLEQSLTNLKTDFKEDWKKFFSKEAPD